MENQFKVFVAGAKELKEERNSLKVLANNLNAKYQTQNINIVVLSYEDFDDDQDVYNDFITTKADIVIFIIDKRLGEKTKEELFVATNSFNKSHHPEVMVFIHDDGQDITPEMAEAKGVIHGRLGNRYYVDYKDLDFLTFKARDRIVRYIEENSSSTTSNKNQNTNNQLSESEKEYSVQKSKRNPYKLLACLLALIIASMFVWHTFFPPTTLILAGGGSARCFINKNSSINIEDYPNSWNCALPSGSSLRLLTEEVQQYIRNNHSNNYATICMSASRMDRGSFIKKHESVCDDAKDYGIVEVLIGYDKLIVYISNALFENKSFIEGLALSTDTITCTQLDSLMTRINRNKKEAKIYTTTETSGTLESYKTALHDIDSTIIHEYDVFYEATSAAVFNRIEKSDSQYLILGSNYYFVDALRKQNDTYKKLVLIKDNDRKTIEKPIYLYFVTYDKNKSSNYSISKPIRKFLKDIHLEIIDPDDGTQVHNKNTWDCLIKGGCNVQYPEFIGRISK